MAWFDNLLNHFALYPAHLFARLFVMALSKSTVLVSLRAAARLGDAAGGHYVSQTSMPPRWRGWRWCWGPRRVRC